MSAPRSGLQPPADPSSDLTPNPTPEARPEAVLADHIELADDLAHLLAYYVELGGHAKRLALDQIAMRHASNSRVCIGCGESGTENAAIAHSGSCPAGNILRIFRALDTSSGVKVAQKVSVVEAVDRGLSHLFHEPWAVATVLDSESGIEEVRDALGRCIVDMYGSTIPEEDEARYVRRIVACVNFCAGMPTEQLEARKVAA